MFPILRPSVLHKKGIQGRSVLRLGRHGSNNRHDMVPTMAQCDDGRLSIQVFVDPSNGEIEHAAPVVTAYSDNSAIILWWWNATSRIEVWDWDAPLLCIYWWHCACVDAKRELYQYKIYTVRDFKFMTLCSNKILNIQGVPKKANDSKWL